MVILCSLTILSSLVTCQLLHSCFRGKPFGCPVSFWILLQSSVYWSAMHCQGRKSDLTRSRHYDLSCLSATLDSVQFNWFEACSGQPVGDLNRLVSTDQKWSHDIFFFLFTNSSWRCKDNRFSCYYLCHRIMCCEIFDYFVLRINFDILLLFFVLFELKARNSAEKRMHWDIRKLYLGPYIPCSISKPRL